MKKHISFFILLGSIFALSGCDLSSLLGGENKDASSFSFSIANLVDPLHIFHEEEPTNQNNVNNQNTNGNNTSGNNTGGNNNGSNTGGQTQTGTLLDILKEKAKTIGSKMLNKSESAITFADYEDESSTADAYYYESTSLTFVDVESYSDTYNTTIAETIKNYLPSGATLTTNNDYLELMDEYGVAYYDRYYSDGEYTYNVYVEAYDEMSDGTETYPAETFASVYIYKTSQQSAFDSYFSEE